MKIVIEHDDDCPLGREGLRAYWEARDALSSTPPEARATPEDQEALAVAEFELECKQVCECGAADRKAQESQAIIDAEVAANERMAWLAGLSEEDIP